MFIASTIRRHAQSVKPICLFFLRFSEFSFSVKKSFRKRNIQFSSRGFFPFPETTHDAQAYARAYCRIVIGLTNTCVGVLRLGSQRWWVRIQPKVVGWNIHSQNFLLVFRYSLTHSCCLIQKKQGFFHKNQCFFISGLFFSWKISIFRRNWNKLEFPNIFWKIWKTFVFPKQPITLKVF